MHATDALKEDALNEAGRLMQVCNACRYCEGVCAVFPAMALRRSFSDGDLNYLANLCHGCSACFYDCQFSPPHEFAINVPRTFAAVRAKSYRHYAWPGFLSGLFDRNGLAISLITALSIAIFIAGFVLAADPGVLLGRHVEPGAFYRVMPHNAMAVIFGGAFLYALFAMLMSLRSFWRDISRPEGAATAAAFGHASKNTLQLTYLDGGGSGCMNDNERPTDRRRFYHHLTFYGFLLCFAATSVATLYHYLLGMVAPYPWYDLPVVLGTLGGIGLLIGPIGLLRAKLQRDPATLDEPRLGMDTGFIVMLFLTSLTGLLLMLLRETPAMGLLLALHLGIVFSLFITMPYSKFVHGLFRFAALLRYGMEQKQIRSVPAE